MNWRKVHRSNVWAATNQRPWELLYTFLWGSAEWRIYHKGIMVAAGRIPASDHAAIREKVQRIYETIKETHHA